MHPAHQLIAQQISSAASTPHWTVYITAVVVPVVALIAAWIAFRQSQIARNKLKLDLYDKRIAIYDVVRKTLGIATSHGKLTQDDEVEYLSGIRTAQWLFGPEVAEYLTKTLWHKIVDFSLHNAMLSSTDREERSKHIHARAETIKWLVEQYDELDKLCGPYLRLKH
ncbi:hypothetical protein K4L06_17095 [Lysobacter sp. BMK333-48F3]|uniref:hypothetical protein n=1 Tax=Lysobacter sp. BMK333-48F3 TaxID=2867962 RepID=UPI001C8C4C5E|nr:hypothetical protein [Lysobacter sp. BMK333-48F3]MBX9403027.1 hypothetical protein [Lysobacter sp. BMK333-48F3]